MSKAADCNELHRGASEDARSARRDRVLVVDDEPKTRLISSEILSIDGYRVDTAEDGRAALAAFEERGRFDAVITDIRMPGMGGIDLLEKIRAIDADVPVIILTGYATLETATRAVARGAFDYLQKPIDFDRLRETLRRALERYRLVKENRRLVRELAAANARLSLVNAQLAKDVEERTRELALERDLLARIHAAVPTALGVFDTSLHLVHGNEAWRALGGYEAPLCEAIGPEVAAIAMAGEGAVRHARRAVAPAGERERIYDVSILPLAGIRALVAAQDLTEAVRLEEELVQAEKLSSLGTLAGGIVHDLSNPVTAVLGTAQLLEQDLGGRHLEATQTIIEAARYMREVCLGLTAYARRVRPEDPPVARDPGELCTKALAIVRSARKLVDVEVAERYAPDAPPVRAAANELLQILVNLIVNAADAAPHGHIEVRTARGPGGALEIAVSDDGPGVPEAARARIFEPFFTTKPPGKGTGLGLYISRRIARRLGGDIRLEPGTAGATFVVELPAG